MLFRSPYTKDQHLLYLRLLGLFRIVHIRSFQLYQAQMCIRDRAQEVFDDEPIRERFVECAVEENIPERVRVEKKAAERVTRNHKIRTDTGIEITFPSEYANNPDFIEFASTPNGLISIELKNIGHIENRR